MARLILSAAAAQTPYAVMLIVSVSGADDGLARSGLGEADFAVSLLSGEPEREPVTWPVDRVTEGPAGCYSVVLAPANAELEETIGRDVFCVVVSGPTESGWADDRGQVLARFA